ncbi:MAG: flagellar biosynthesis repressor FlbT [Alphaproteobacteria bacterium]|nr:MAG: flagellar biosynthesis repressor FlbT [Alphaproteobacteria bacterium]
MAGLILKLTPGERVMINGVVVENGDHRTRLRIVTENANVLRLRDAIHPDEVNTPVRRVCYIAQLVLACDVTPEAARPQLLTGIEQLSQVFTDPDSRARLDEATAALAEGRFYQVLKALRGLLAREARLMSYAAARGFGPERRPGRRMHPEGEIGAHP